MFVDFCTNFVAAHAFIFPSRTVAIVQTHHGLILTSHPAGIRRSTAVQPGARTQKAKGGDNGETNVAFDYAVHSVS
jgi:hypothetical protein